MRRPGVRSGALKGLRRVRQDGKLYVYHRATGTRMPDLPETHPDFLAAYLAAERGTGPTRPRGRGKPGSLLAGWHGYCRSDAFRQLSASYQRVRQRDGDKLVQKAGTVMLRAIRPGHVQADLNALAPHPARERRKTWRALMGWALTAGLVEDDPTRHVTTPRPPRATQHAPWTDDDIAAFRARWPIDTPQRLAFELIHWAGPRISDAVRLGPGMVSPDGWLEYRQQKTGGRVAIPLHRALPPFVDPADRDQLRAAIEARPHRHLTWITTAHGTSRSQKSASQWFAAAARAAGLTGGKSAHGLRVTRAIKLAEGGATTHQIGAWTGHESLKEIEHYSRQADRKRLLMGTDGDRNLFRSPDPEQNNAAKG